MKDRKTEDQGFVHSEDNSGIEDRRDGRGSDVSMEHANSNDGAEQLEANEEISTLPQRYAKGCTGIWLEQR